MDITEREITKIAREAEKLVLLTLREKGVGTAEIDLIHALRHHPGCTQAALAELLHADKVSVKVLPTHDKWFGVTYAEDKQIVIDSFAKLVADGVIPQALSFAGAADLTTYINDVVTPFISSAAYAPYIAPVAGLGNLNILGLIRFSIYQEGNGWFLLPILSVVSQIFMQKLTMKSSPMDPSQAGSQKMMIYVMTFMSLYFCASYNSAFALYWVVSNIYAIVEQICFNKYFEQQDRKAAKAEEVGI